MDLIFLTLLFTKTQLMHTLVELQNINMTSAKLTSWGRGKNGSPWSSRVIRR